MDGKISGNYLKTQNDKTDRKRDYKLSFLKKKMNTRFEHKNNLNTIGTYSVDILKNKVTTYIF